MAWVTEIPGRGWSSPIVWRGRVFVTSAISPGAFKAPSTGIFGNDYAAELEKQGLSDDEITKRVVGPRHRADRARPATISYMVYALDAATGRVVWQQEAHRGKPFGGRHRKNTYASETPATDGERLYASFGGNVGVFCYTLDGTPLWTHTWPPQPIYLDFGTASSPVVHDGRVYQLHDNDGAVVPRRARRARPARRSGTSSGPIWPAAWRPGWATPLVWETRIAHRDRDDRPRLRHQLRHRRPASCGA